MLDPDSRCLLTDALRAPAGYEFAEGLVTTYSLDLTTLLTIPLHLAFAVGGSREDLLRDPVALLEALRRQAGRLTVFAQAGAVHVPKVQSVLYGLLESVVVPAAPASRGILHAKIWVLRFENIDSREALLRLVVATRNLTDDRSWDIALHLEGVPGGRERQQNAQLAALLKALPSLSTGGDSHHSVARARADRLADACHRTTWILPVGVDSVRFHAIGPTLPRFRVQRSERLAVLSPFVDPPTLAMLAKTAGEGAAALISRPESLAALPPRALEGFASIFTLSEAVETEDGEDSEGATASNMAGSVRHGLHAKVYLQQDGQRVRLLVGSANATSPALVAASNIEILAELEGHSRALGSIEDLVGEPGLGKYLVPFTPGDAAEAETARQAAERRLEEARRDLVACDLRLKCRPAEGSQDEYELTIEAARRPAMEGIAEARVWPISLGDEHAATLGRPEPGQAVLVGRFSAVSLTRFLAFQLVDTATELRERFVLQLPAEGFPEHRDAAVVAAIVNNREAFLRYLALLLQDLEADGLATSPSAARAPEWLSAGNNGQDAPLLERLVRAFSRDRKRLESVDRLLRELEDSPAGRDSIPERFLDLWTLFRSVIDREERP